MKFKRESILLITGLLLGFLLLANLPVIQAQDVAWRHYVEHENGEKCFHYHPDFSFTIFEKGDLDTLLIENKLPLPIPAKQKDKYGMVRILLNSFFDVDTGSTYIWQVTDHAVGQNGSIEATIDTIPWKDPNILTPIQLKFDGSQPPQPKNVRLTSIGDTAAFLQWTFQFGYIYSIYRRTIHDQLIGHFENRVFERIADSLNAGHFWDAGLQADHEYGYVLIARRSDTTLSVHSREVMTQEPFMQHAFVNRSNYPVRGEFQYTRLDSLIGVAGYRPAYLGGGWTHREVDYTTLKNNSWQPRSIALSARSNVERATSFDFNRDGFDDLLLDRTEGMTIFIRDKYSNRPEFTGDFSISAVPGKSVPIDVNSDGYIDLIKGDHYYLNNRGRSLLSGVVIKALNGENIDYVADLNGDGYADLISGDRVLKGHKDGQFILAAEIHLPKFYTASNFTAGKGKELLALYGDQIRLLEFDRDFNQKESFLGHIDSVRRYSNFSLDPVELNGDDKMDLVVTESRRNAYDYPLGQRTSFLVNEDERLELKEIKNGNGTEDLPFISLKNDQIGRLNKLPETQIIHGHNQEKLNYETYLQNSPQHEAPTTPGGLTAKVNKNNATIRWNRSTDDLTPDSLINYRVQIIHGESGRVFLNNGYKNYGPLDDPELSAISRLFVNLHDLKAGTYFVKVKAIDSHHKESSYSPAQRLTISEDEQVSPPTAVRDTLIEQQIHLTFEMHSFYDSVEVYRSTSLTSAGTPIARLRLGHYKFIDGDLNPDQTYYYRLKSYYEGEASSFTDAVEVKAPGILINRFKISDDIHEIIDIKRADLNRDGWVDMVLLMDLVDQEGHTAIVVPGTENGYSFSRRRNVIDRTKKGQNKMFIRDWNRDGQLDIMMFTDFAFRTSSEPAMTLHILKGYNRVKSQKLDIVIPDNVTDQLMMLDTYDFDLDGVDEGVFYNGKNLWMGTLHIEEGYMEFRKRVDGDLVKPFLVNLYDYNQDGYGDILMMSDSLNKPVVLENRQGDDFVMQDLSIHPGIDGNVEYKSLETMWINQDGYPDISAIRLSGSGTDRNWRHDMYIYDSSSQQYHLDGPSMGDLNFTRFLSALHYDNDGYMDFSAEKNGRIYNWENIENTGFENYTFPYSKECCLGKLYHFDIDRDHDPDFLFTYNNPYLQWGDEPHKKVHWFLNSGSPDIVPPSVPEITNVSFDHEGLKVQWTPSKSNWSLDGHLSYHLVIGNEGNAYVSLGAVDRSTGQLGIWKPGSGIHKTKVHIRGLNLGEYQFKVAAVDPRGLSSGFSNEYIYRHTYLEGGKSRLPTSFKLKQNYPNPFNPTTQIEYSLPKTSRVRLTVYNVMGRHIATLVDGKKSAGEYQMSLNAGSWSSGVYIYRIQAGDYNETRKMLLVK